MLADDWRTERASGAIPTAAHHHRPAEGLSGSAREDPAPAAPVRRGLQAHDAVTPASNSQVQIIICTYNYLYLYSFQEMLCHGVVISNCNTGCMFRD